MITFRSIFLTLAIVGYSLVIANSAQALPYYQEVLADNPIAYYRLGEASGVTAADSAPPAQNGAYVNSPTLGVTGALSPADPNTAANFNGTTQYATTPFLFDPSATDWTVELWINREADQSATQPGFVSQTNGTGLGRSWLYINSGNGVSSFFGGVETAWLGGALTLNDWVYVALTFDNATDTLTFYKDGAATGGGGVVVPEASDGTMVLAATKDLSQLFDGSLDEVAFYTSTLSSADISAHYNARFNAVVPEPNAFYLGAIGVGLAIVLAVKRRR